tara:strand:- start:160 stop:570 length:411 start_codon:yes stop_codon:yes gene_type:complete
MSSSSSRVVEITEIDELEKIAKEFSRNLIVMDFSATWCMPCKSIKPFFKELSIQYKDCVFLAIDANDGEELLNFFNIKSLPTFIFMKQRKAFDILEGADRDKLTQKIISSIDFDVSTLQKNEEETQQTTEDIQQTD